MKRSHDYDNWQPLGAWPISYAPARPIWKAPPVHASKHRKARAQRFAAKGAKR